MNNLDDVYQSMMHTYERLEDTIGALIDSGNQDALLRVFRNADDVLESIATLLNSKGFPNEKRGTYIEELNKKEATLSIAKESAYGKAL